MSESCAREGQCTTMIGGLAALILLTSLCEWTSYNYCVTHLYLILDTFCNFKCFLIASCCNLIFICLFPAALVQTTEFSKQISLTVAEPGENVTLTCAIIGKEIGLFYWYKLNFGYMIETVVSATFTTMILTEQFNSPRFNIKKVGNEYSLIIRNVSKEDEATYLCQSGGAYLMKFINGTILAVNGKYICGLLSIHTILDIALLSCASVNHTDPKDQMTSLSVKQSPEAASVKKGKPVVLQCSLLSTHKETRVQCPGEHRVHWFKERSGGFHPGIIYTHSNRSDKQEERSCDYSLSKTIQDSSDDGTYYCAVVTCGKILFGQGTKVETSMYSCII